MTLNQNGESTQGSCGLLNWDLSYRAEQNIVFVQTVGPLDHTTLAAMFAATVAFAETRGCQRILADHRNSTLKLDPLEIYYAPRTLIHRGADSKYFAALVFAQITEDLQFLENVCRNSGLHISMYSDLNRALQWVSGEAAPPVEPQPSPMPGASLPKHE